MPAKQAVLYSHLESILGDDRVFSGEEAASYAVDGVVPQVAAVPASVEEVAEIMRLAHRERAAVIPWGGGTTMALGNIPRHYDIALCLSRLNDVGEYEPADLTATVQAGKTLAEFQRHLARAGQFLPLDPPLGEEATIGGILATNAAGPSRHAYGTVRDLVLGVRAVTANGRIVKAGGRVVKNVAGYDLCRLLIGSLGTLAIIVEASFKVAPLPKAQQTLVVFVPSAQEAHRLAGQAARLSLRAVELLNAAAVKQVAALDEAPEDAFALVLAAAGEPAAVERSLGEIGELAQQAPAASLRQVDASTDGRLWERIVGLSRASGSGASLVCKAAVLPSRLLALIDSMPAARPGGEPQPLVVSHLTAGVVYSVWQLPDSELSDPALDLIASVRRAVAALDGTLVVEACPPPLKERIDVWGEPGADFPLMQRIKKQFDPQGILSPGRFLGRL